MKLEKCKEGYQDEMSFNQKQSLKLNTDIDIKTKLQSTNLQEITMIERTNDKTKVCIKGQDHIKKYS